MKKGILGMLIIMESFFLLLSMVIAIINDEQSWLCFLLTALGTAALGSLCVFWSRRGENKRMRRADNFLVVALSWIVFSIIGMVPYLYLADMDLASAFFETMKGLHNLGLLGYEIELRVIIIKDNYKRLSQIAEYITLNLPFVSQVSFMGLEITGYADRNYQRVWVEPIDFSPYLTDAIRHLECCNISAKVFNVPYCLLPIILWPYACKSISAWKKTNLQQCKNCSQLKDCCGVFSTSKRYSPFIHAI